jgi:hypothetical protein
LALAAPCRRRVALMATASGDAIGLQLIAEHVRTVRKTSAVTAIASASRRRQPLDDRCWFVPLVGSDRPRPGVACA